jgi:hypothetical protein
MFCICFSVCGVNVRSAGWSPATATAAAVATPAITTPSPSHSLRRGCPKRFIEPSFVDSPGPRANTLQAKTLRFRAAGDGPKACEKAPRKATSDEALTVLGQAIPPGSMVVAFGLSWRLRDVPLPETAGATGVGESLAVPRAASVES